MAKNVILLNIFFGIFLVGATIETRLKQWMESNILFYFKKMWLYKHHEYHPDKYLILINDES